MTDKGMAFDNTWVRHVFNISAILLQSKVFTYCILGNINLLSCAVY